MDPGRRLIILSASRWLPTGLLIPVLVLLLSGRGLSLAQVGQVLAVYSVVTILLELPTGGLADSWGRRNVSVLSALLQGAGMVVLAVWGAWPPILLAAALLGAARALSSGPIESWFVDTMHASGRTEVEGGLARGQVAESLALGTGAVLGGLLPSLAPGLPATGTGLLDLSVPLLVAAVAAALHGVLTAVLLTSAPSGRSVVGTMGHAVRTAARTRPIRRLLLVTLCLGAVLSGVELLAPDRFAALMGSASGAAALFGVLTAAAFGVAALGAAASTRLPGARPVVGAVAFVAMGLCALALAIPLLPGAAAAYLALYVAVGVQGPVMAALFHARIAADVRSTMLSVDSLALQAGGAIATLVVGGLAEGVGIGAALALITLMAALAAVTLMGERRHAV